MDSVKFYWAAESVDSVEWWRNEDICQIDEKSFNASPTQAFFN